MEAWVQILVSMTQFSFISTSKSFPCIYVTSRWVLAHAHGDLPNQITQQCVSSTLSLHFQIHCSSSDFEEKLSYRERNSPTISDPRTHLGDCLARKMYVSMYVYVYACACVCTCTSAHREMQKSEGLGKKREDGELASWMLLVRYCTLVISKKEEDEKPRCQEEASIHDCADYR